MPHVNMIIFGLVDTGSHKEEEVHHNFTSSDTTVWAVQSLNGTAYNYIMRNWFTLSRVINVVLDIKCSK